MWVVLKRTDSLSISHLRLERPRRPRPFIQSDVGRRPASMFAWCWMACSSASTLLRGTGHLQTGHTLCWSFNKHSVWKVCPQVSASTSLCAKASKQIEHSIFPIGNKNEDISWVMPQQICECITSSQLDPQCNHQKKERKNHAETLCSWSDCLRMIKKEDASACIKSPVIAYHSIGTQAALVPASNMIHSRAE